MSDRIRCKCSVEFDDDTFKSHFSKCSKFKDAFKEFDNEYGLLLKKYAQPQENLPILKFLLKQYIGVIDNKIIKWRQSEIMNNQNPMSERSFPYQPKESNIPNNDKNIIQKIIPNQNIEPSIPQDIHHGNIQHMSSKILSDNNPNSHSNSNVKKNNNFDDFDNMQIDKNDFYSSREVKKNFIDFDNFKNSNLFPGNFGNKNNNDSNMPNFNREYGEHQKNPIIPKEKYEFFNNDKNDKILIENNVQMKNNIYEHNNNYNFPMEEEEKCTNCLKAGDLVPFECFHMICLKCVLNLAERDLNNVRCPKNDCNQNVSYEYLKMILGNDKINEIESINVGKILNDLGKQIVCPNQECKEMIFFEVGKVDYNTKDEKNQKISKQAAESYAQNRCKCPRCQKEFCITCNFSPFHLGKTCEEQKKFKEAKKCRYCMAVISQSNTGPADNVCKADDCLTAFKVSCHKKLNCGHQCFGTKYDKECPPCLMPSCEKYVNYYDQSENDYCNICFSEGLGSAPVILFKCHHYVHYKCAEECLKKKWIGPKITFNHMNCPNCKNQMDCPNTNPIQLEINENKNLYENIVKMALERLKFEGLEKDNLLTDPNSPYYGKKIDFALKKLSYYMCYECKKPYFAGLRDCRGGPDEDNNPNRKYDPKDLICGAHANIAGVGGVTECPKHGKDFIEYKCKFCCHIASWFCWGTTHFCEDCHAKQCKGDYVSKYTKDKLPKCKGLSECPIKVKHPDNGEEYALGCSVCRNASDNYKNF